MSEELIKLYAQKHRITQNYGPGPNAKETEEIRNVLKDRIPSVQTALDYGAGNSHLLDDLFPDDEVHKTRYDPAIPEISAEPEGTFGLVTCTDVLEHIPEDELPDFLDGLASHIYTGFGFFTVCTIKASHKLPDGQNCHPTVRPNDWWEKKIAEHFDVISVTPAERKHAFFYLVQRKCP